jgi:hypothetical protein
MNHLGGSGCFGLGWVVPPESCLRRSCVSHLWMATQEQRDWRCSIHEASSATTSQMGLCWPTKLRELRPDGQRVVDVDRMERVRVSLRIASKRSRLSLHLAIWCKMRFMAKGGLSKSCGKSAPPLQSVRTKYLAVSPVTDISERPDFEVVQESSHPNFLKLKLDGKTWVVKSSS